jgi:hypothetical protein
MIKTVMMAAPFPGLEDQQQINDLWTYRKQFNADGSTKT